MRTRAPIVLVDIDGTTGDFAARFDEGLARLHPEWVGKVSSREKFSLWSDDPVRNAAVRDVIDEPGFSAQLDVYDGARAAMIEMLHDGIEVLTCSTPVAGNVNSASERVAWVARHLGRRFTGDRMNLVGDKTLLFGDVLADDKPRITGRRATPDWAQVYFDQPYNRVDAEGLPDIPRLTVWSDWRAVISPMLDALES